jgi:hypothetical protein
MRGCWRFEQVLLVGLGAIGRVRPDAASGVCPCDHMNTWVEMRSPALAPSERGTARASRAGTARSSRRQPTILGRRPSPRAPSAAHQSRRGPAPASPQPSRGDHIQTATARFLEVSSLIPSGRYPAQSVGSEPAGVGDRGQRLAGSPARQAPPRPIPVSPSQTRSKGWGLERGCLGPIRGSEV